jgi:hypothetical protein
VKKLTVVIVGEYYFSSIYKILFNILLSRLTPYMDKIEIISMDFDIIDYMPIKYFLLDTGKKI